MEDTRSSEKFINQQVQQLTLGGTQLRQQTAIGLKNVSQPLLRKILGICLTEYGVFAQAVSIYNAQDWLSPYKGTGWAIDDEVAQRIPEGINKRLVIRSERRWESTLEGAKYYLYYSCESLDSGLVELARLIADERCDGALTIQGLYLIKYTGVTLVEPLIRLLNNPNEEIRCGMLTMLAVFDDPRSYGPIRKALSDPSGQVRDIAATIVKRLDIPPEVQAQKEIVKEIVKIPCKYCGTYVENTARFCYSCGAPLSK